MSLKPGRVALGILLALAILFVAARLRYPGMATVKLPAADCNADLWKHVYQPERLRVIEPCTAVEGRVVSVHRESDGDLHIALDPDQKSILNLINLAHGHGHLVVDPMEQEGAAGISAPASSGCPAVNCVSKYRFPFQ